MVTFVSEISVRDTQLKKEKVFLNSGVSEKKRSAAVLSQWAERIKHKKASSKEQCTNQMKKKESLFLFLFFLLCIVL